MGNLMWKKWLFCLLAAASTCGVAWAANAPASVTGAMPAQAISLRWQKVQSAQGGRPEVWAHLFVVPKGHSKEREQMLTEKRTGPIRRADIDTGPSIAPSPFTLETYANSGGALRRLGRASFTQSKDVQEIHTRYLDTRTKRAPVLIMHFGYTHWHEWEVLTFPNGWSGKAAHQTFYWGGEAGTYSTQSFGRSERGKLVIDEEVGHGVDDDKIGHGDDPTKTARVERGVYRWNGTQWADRSQKWFVIGASSKSKSDITRVVAKQGFGEIVRSNDYPRLRRGLWLWVAGRYRSEKDAREHAQMMRNSKPKQNAMVRRAL